MTEQEAIKVLTDKHTNITTDICDGKEWKKLKPARELAVSALKKIQEYQKIGTVEECREAMKKQKKKSLKLKSYCGFDSFECPICEATVDYKNIYCHRCGQRLE